MNENGKRDYVAETRADFEEFDRATHFSVAERQYHEDEAQMEYLRRWAERKAARKAVRYPEYWAAVRIFVLIVSGSLTTGLSFAAREGTVSPWWVLVGVIVFSAAYLSPRGN